ncbi:MAG: acyltransferase [Eubacterium sp.]|nr:acyltransferase [Eubacterium sp.]
MYNKNAVCYNDVKNNSKGGSNMRKYYLDNIRWLTIVCVVIFHVIYMFNGEAKAGVIGPFKDVQYQDALQYLLYPWMMILLFIVAGMCSRYYLERHTVKEFVKSRTVKLLVPSTIGLFVFQWIQGYFNMQLSGAFDKIEAPKLMLYPIMAISGIGVLWFIQTLWLFSIVLALIRHFEKGKLYGLCGKINIIIAIALVIPVYASSFVLNTPVIVAYRFGIYGMTFLLGYFVFAHDGVIERISKWSVPLIILTVLLGGVYLYLHFGDNYAENPTFNSIPAIAYGWSACLAVLGSAYKWYNRQTKISSFMTKRSYGLYIFHYLPLSASAYLLTKYTQLSALPIYLIVLVCGFAGGLLLNEIISKIPFIRWAVIGIAKEKKDV